MVSVSRASSSNFVSAGAGMMSESMITQTYIRLIVTGGCVFMDASGT
jgi:hypothetical protein